MLTWAPRVPSRKSRFAKTGSPSRERPMGSRRSILSKKRAWSRSTPVARRHLLAGPRRHEDLGLDARDPHVRGLRHRRRQHALLDEEHVGVELGALVPRANDVDHAEEADRSRPSGSGVSTTTTSSSWTYWPSATPSQKSSGMASTVPRTRPTASLMRTPREEARPRWRVGSAADRPGAGAVAARGPRSARGCSGLADRGPRPRPAEAGRGTPRRPGRTACANGSAPDTSSRTTPVSAAWMARPWARRWYQE